MPVRLIRTLTTWRHDVTNQPRLLLAAKTAVAAAAAWYLVPFVPFADDKYSYYAPLGVLVSMYPTLARSVRSGVQTLVGLAIGIALGIGVGLGSLAIGAPGVVAIALVIGIGVLLGGIRSLGSGADWMPIAGLFVLLLGGASVEEFSVSYLVDVAFGIVVGVLVNVLVFPPLYLRRAGSRLTALRDLVAKQLKKMADAVEEGSPDPDDLDDMMDDLTRTAGAVRAEVNEADESRTGNPRGRRRRHREEAQQNYSRLRALERTVFFVRDLADVLGTMDDGAREKLGDEGRAALCTAMRDTAELVATPANAEESRERLETAERSVDALTVALDERASGRPSAVANDLTAAVCLRRVIAASRPFVK
jgi:uncharacterized membrane protein YgaE (UPF0421/DUF939 family)